jgi:hypothetical protein
VLLKDKAGKVPCGLELPRVEKDSLVSFVLILACDNHWHALGSFGITFTRILTDHLENLDFASQYPGYTSYELVVCRGVEKLGQIKISSDLIKAIR